MRSSVRAPGVRRSLRAHVVEHRLRQARQQRHAPTQRLGEVDLAGHRRLGDRGHLLGAAARVGQQVDDLVLEQRRVGVHHHEVLGAAVQSGALDGEVEADAPRRPTRASSRRPSWSGPRTTSS